MAERWRHVEEVMGTVFSFDIRGGRPSGVREALDAAVAELHRVDEVFSTYREGSQVSRLARGELTTADCDPEVGAVLALCGEAEQLSGGWFSARYAGSVDPTGLVKGWATERAARRIAGAGVDGVSVNGGGDAQLYGAPGPDRPWRIGVADPLRPGALAAIVSGAGEVAVASSGTAERGRHIVDPHTGLAAEADLAAVTVVAPSLTWADTWATAAFAMGSERALPWLESLDGTEALLILEDGAVRCTKGLEVYLR
ncbi:FAD:protein FMN transferase [Streptomyces sp. NPDC005318]|uniref:FAD:protein FMN transferase n=1 Tax=Streptomyces sp. NPDC005318 TaxID=3157031 RepID=UPI0033A1B114